MQPTKNKEAEVSPSDRKQEVQGSRREAMQADEEAEAMQAEEEAMTVLTEFPFVKAIADLMEQEHGHSSKKQDKSARSKFNQFLALHVSRHLSLDSLPATALTRKLMGQFTTFLLDDPKIHWQTSMNYISCVKRQLEECIDTKLFSENEKWYCRLRGNLNKQYVLKCLTEGKALKAQAPVMTIVDLETLGRALFCMNTKKSLKDRTFLNMQWNAIGRSSDVGSLAFAGLQWNQSCLLVRLARVKVRKQHTIAVVCSPLRWEIDPFHSLACQIVCDAFYIGRELFDQIGVANKEEDRISAYINQLLSKLSSCIDADLTFNLKSQSSRRGSAVQASSSEHVNLSDVAHRGRWTMDGFATLLDYIAETSAADQKVARVLSGWDDPKHAVKPPSLFRESDSKSVRDRKAAFADYLFFHYTDRLPSQSLRHVLAASLLLYIDKTYAVNPTHAVHRAMLAAVRNVDPSQPENKALQLLCTWGSTTRHSFVLDNMVSLPAAEVVGNLENGDKEDRFVSAHTFSDTLTKLVGSSRSLADEVSKVKSQLDRMEEQQRQLFSSLQTIQELLTKPSVRVPSVSKVSKPQSAKGWPGNLNSLVGVSLSSLFYQFLFEELDGVPIDRRNRAQSEARSAMIIAQSFIEGRGPPPYSSLLTIDAREHWKADVKQLDLAIEETVLAHLDSKEIAPGKRKRKLTRSAAGIVRTWHKKRKATHGDA